jgi:hypothetical protein
MAQLCLQDAILLAEEGDHVALLGLEPAKQTRQQHLERHHASTPTPAGLASVLGHYGVEHIDQGDNIRPYACLHTRVEFVSVVESLHRSEVPIDTVRQGLQPGSNEFAPFRVEAAPILSETASLLAKRT